MSKELTNSILDVGTGPDSGAATEVLADALPNTERDFYQAYSWCLNPYPTVGEALRHLAEEITRLAKVQPQWQLDEVTLNVYLLSCAVLNAVDDYLRGPTFLIPGAWSALRLTRAARWVVEKLSALRRWRGRVRARGWRRRFQTCLDAFLMAWLDSACNRAALLQASSDLKGCLPAPLAAELLAAPTYFPSAFRKHDLTHLDVLTLGQRFADRFPQRQQPILLTGLRTAGSYFAPLLCAFLKTRGYRQVTCLTVRPDKGPGATERKALRHAARANNLAVVVDDSPRTGGALVTAVGLLRSAGFAPGWIAVLVPVHATGRDWRDKPEALALDGTAIIALEQKDWRKNQLLEPEAVEDRLTEYFQDPTVAGVCVVTSSRAEEINADLQNSVDEPRRSRLKRVYEVRVQTSEGQAQIHYVLAKSVGLGWLSYHAFLAGQRLAAYVPPVLGQRGGILYSQWLPQSDALTEGDRAAWIETAATYIAARARSLSLGSNPLPKLALEWHHDGTRMLERVLSKAHGGAVPAALKRPSIRRRLANQPCPRPTLIDSKMQRCEWITGPAGWRKTDYEHHGMGKNELNMVDPAYDLAEAILDWSLSQPQENALLRAYRKESGDADVEQRLFLSKLLAGTWAMSTALNALFHQPALSHRQQDFHRQFVNAWHFLTVQTVRLCGALCRPPQAPQWRSPLVVLDVDGVLDRRIFGFPHTTAAGIEALALLHAHDVAVALDTARSAVEVQEYCQAYGLVGGVAEMGSYVWDAVGQRGRAVVVPESLCQLEKLRKALRQIPGVFLDDRHQHSIRAWTYEDSTRQPERRSLLSLLYSHGSAAASRVPVPLPTLTAQHLMASLQLDRLRMHRTGIDTTIVAQEVDKGQGLTALLEWVGHPVVETTAIGDSEHDLPMFRAAGRCFAPGQIGCASLARKVGCTIDKHSFQRGLLSIVRGIVHLRGRYCPRCAGAKVGWPREPKLFFDLLQAADRGRLSRWLRAVLDRRAWQIFVR
jgi:hydroxymethylpyrimidine pyrophosphatase-like HAD family hydrolase